MAGENKFVATNAKAGKGKKAGKGGNEYQRNKQPRRIRFRDLLGTLDFSGFLSYDQITGRLPYVLFLSLLAIGYIWNRHSAERSVREINQTQKELIELEWYYDTAKDELARKSRQSAVAEMVKEQEIKELVRPPRVIEIEKKKTKRPKEGTASASRF